jgi:3-hydroxybutyryl-CoA dehydrogenase
VRRNGRFIHVLLLAPSLKKTARIVLPLSLSLEILNMIHSICICGAGTMGSGIAQVCAQAGIFSIQYDVSQEMLLKSQKNITASLQMLVDKQKISAEEKAETLQRLQFTNSIDLCVADMVVEAIVEKKAAKLALFSQLAEMNHGDTIFASNTSSISINELQKSTMHPHRVVGLHFFNPAPVMKLVEVVKGEQTSEEVVNAALALCQQLNKTAVLCQDAPGFIVNRVARHYYLEAMHQVEQGYITIEQADAIMEAHGFRMGPFKLMDLIGMDINYSVSQQVWDALGQPARLQPSPLQAAKVQAGELGKKTGKGFYTYNQ